jgi:hypothetical protein
MGNPGIVMYSWTLAWHRRFSGARCEPGANARSAALALIPMGDWCGSVPQPHRRETGRVMCFAARCGPDRLQRRKTMRQGDDLPVYLGLSMGDRITVATVTNLMRSTPAEPGVRSAAADCPCGRNRRRSGSHLGQRPRHEDVGATDGRRARGARPDRRGRDVPSFDER